MALEVGERVGDYQVIQVLGVGGMGQVYKVRNVISDRVEAMKVLLPNLEGNAELADRFMREIKVQASMDHPNIAALHTALRVDNQLVMVMEFVEGQTIEALLRQGTLPLAAAINYTQQILSALSYAHARGIIHRDIKPPNMMLTPSGEVKLMDFGIAKITADPKLTRTGHTLGSLFYMSPEQINGVPLDGRADLYSLGVSLYEMVTGKRPFQGDSDYSIMSAHLLSRPIPPIQVHPQVPESLNEIIMISIAKDPAQRFQTAEAFRAALTHAAAGLGVAPAFSAAAVNTPPPQPPAAPTPVPVAAAPPPPPPTQTAIPLPAPPPVPQQPVFAAPAVVAAQAKSNRRGLNMAIGSLVTLVVIFAAALEGPKLFGPSSASTDVKKTNPPKPDPAKRADPPPESTTTKDEKQEQTTAQAIPESTPNRTTPDRGTSQSNRKDQPQPSSSTRQAQPSDTPSAASVNEVREEMMLVGTRAASVKQTIRNMETQQNDSGVGIRQDVAAQMSRMDAYLAEADVAMRSRNVASAKKYLKSAEKELERLEKFLGR